MSESPDFSRTAFLSAAVLAGLGAAIFIFIPFPRDELIAWVALGGGSVSALSIAFLFFARWRWTDRGWLMVWVFALTCFVLMLGGLFLPSAYQDLWTAPTMILMLVFAGATIYGFFFGLRHIANVIIGVFK